MSSTMPPPLDDGSASHLAGRRLPETSLAATDGSRVRLRSYEKGRWVLFVYPRTGVPGQTEPDNWSKIPGAKGCTAEACSFRDNLDALTAAGAKRIAGLSVQSTEYQSEAAARLHLPYPLLSDVDHNLTDSLALPTFEAASLTLLKRLTVIIDGDHITHTFYPVFPVEEHVSEVVQWLSENPGK